MARDWSRSVVAVALAVHGDVCGSGDPLPCLAADVAWLEAQLAVWGPSLEFSDHRRFDEAVRELVEAAVAMGRERVQAQAERRASR